MKNIVVLISGNGSNLQAIINACKQKKINGAVRAVFSNKINAFGLRHALREKIPTHVLEINNFSSGDEFDNELIRKIDDYTPDLIALAGYMRILNHNFITHYSGCLLNIHPSLLPKYPGLHTHFRVLENGDKEHGASIHFVNDQLDGGPVILQKKVPVFKKDSQDDIIKRVQIQEHIIYPIVIRWFVDGRLKMYDNKAWLDGLPIANSKLWT